MRMPDDAIQVLEEHKQRHLEFLGVLGAKPEYKKLPTPLKSVKTDRNFARPA